MTQPIKNNSKAQVKVYAQANEGVVHNPAGENFSDIGAKLGGEVNYKGTYLKAQAGAGTSLSGKVELGHEFDIGKNMGLDISAKAQTTRSLYENKSHFTENVHIENTINSLDIKKDIMTEWHSGETRFGLNAKMNFKSRIAKVCLGLEGGMRKSTVPDVAIQESMTNVTLNLGEKKGYITPTVSAEVKMGKNSNFSFVADADLYQGQAGIRYTF